MRRVVVLVVVALAGMWLALMRADAPAAVAAARPDAPHLELIGQFGGRMQAVAAADGYAYVGIGPRLVVFDTRDPAQLIPVGQTAVLDGLVNDVDLVGGRAYVAAGRVLYVMDASAPPALATLGTLAYATVVLDLDIVGDLVYAAAESSALRIISVADPTQPVEVASEISIGSAVAVAVSGRYAYVETGGTLRVIDLADPAHPKQITALAGSSGDLALYGGYAYEAAGNGVRVVSLAKPRKLEAVAYLSLPESAQAVTISGDRLYVATAGAQIYDLANPAAPVALGRLSGTAALDVAVAGDRVYLADALSSLTALDCADPAAPARLAGYTTLDDASGILVTNSTALVTSLGQGLVTLDITDPTAPVRLAALPAVADDDALIDVAVEGNRAWTANGLAGLQLADIATPAAPAWLGGLDNVASYGVAATGDIGYLASGVGGLTIVDMSDLEYPVALHEQGMLVETTALVVERGIAYAGGSNRLELVDVRDPWETLRLSALALEGSIADVMLRAPLVYVTEFLGESWDEPASRLRIVDVSDARQPVELGRIEIAGPARDIALRHTLAYVANGEQGVRVIDVIDPTAPRQVLAQDTIGSAEGVALVGDAILVADGAAGLAIYRLEPDGVVFPTLTPSPSPTPSATPTATPVGADRYESDATCSRARAIPSDGVAQQRSFHAAGDTDWAVFQAQAGVRYVVQAEPVDASPADVALAAYTRCTSTPLQAQDYPFSASARFELQVGETMPIYLRMTNHDPAAGGPGVTYRLSVRKIADAPAASSLVLVAGRRADASLQSNINAVANRAYRVFLNHGYAPADIFYLNNDLAQPGADGPATNANLRAAITGWANGRVSAEHPLTVYLIDHGDYDRFMLDDAAGEYLAPEELDAWLAAVEAAHPGVRVNVIVEACQSGSFIDPPRSISRPGRVVIVSAAVGNNAYASWTGATFSDRFLDALDANASLYSAFQHGRWSAFVASRGQQWAWLDDDGDGAADDARDGRPSQRRGFAYRGTLAEELWSPWVTEATAPAAAVGGWATVAARVLDDEGATRVWAEIYPPSYEPPVAGSAWVADAPVTLTLKTRGENRFAVTWGGFTEPGAYQVVVYAADADGLTAQPVALEVLGGVAGPRLWLPLLVGE